MTDTLAGDAGIERWIRALLSRITFVRRNRTLAWSIAVGLFALALAVRFSVDEHLPTGFPFLSFFPAIVLAAFACGRGPATLCAILSVLAAWYWFVEPRNSLELATPAAVAVGFFVFIAAVDVLVIDLMTTSFERLERERRRTAALLDQRTVLFHELQHRVANTLSLVNMVLAGQQQRLADNPQAQESLGEARHRFDLMARTHRRLHDPAVVERPLEEVLRPLAEDLLQAQSRPEWRVEVRADDLRLSLDQLLTLGQLVLELMTNAFKHAFGPGETGCVQLAVTRLPRDWARLVVADDGSGLAATPAPSVEGNGLGGQITVGLVKSLRGRMHYAPAPHGGTCVVIDFPLDPGAEA